MTRKHTERPVWCWACDSCGLEFPIYELEQWLLPTPDQMRAAGWFVAEKWGDKCPECVEKEMADD